MEGVGWTEGVHERREGEEGEKRRKQAKREWRNERDEARREGQNEANGVNLPGCRGSPSLPRPPEGTLLLLLFIFLLRRTGCVSRDKIYPASFPPLPEIELQEVERRCLLDAPDSSDKMQVNSLSLFLSVYRRKDQASRPGSRSLFLDFFEYFSTAFSVNLA